MYLKVSLKAPNPSEKWV